MAHLALLVIGDCLTCRHGVVEAIGTEGHVADAEYFLA